MKKTLYSTVAIIMALPLMGYLAFQFIDPSHPDLVYVNQPSLFAAKWEKVAHSDSFSEYIDPGRIEKNLDSTVEIVIMRNYFETQTDFDGDKNQGYKSQVSNETIDCFNQTIIVNKMYFLSGNFTSGSLVVEPIEPLSSPIRVNSRSIGFSKIRKVCELANLNTDPQYIRSSFMNNI